MELWLTCKAIIAGEREVNVKESGKLTVSDIIDVSKSSLFHGHVEAIVVVLACFELSVIENDGVSELRQVIK